MNNLVQVINAVFAGDDDNPVPVLNMVVAKGYDHLALADNHRHQGAGAHHQVFQGNTDIGVFPRAMNSMASALPFISR